jgi:hypothetical protein
LDADINMDDAFAYVDLHASQVFEEYCLVQNAWEGKVNSEEILLKILADA